MSPSHLRDEYISALCLLSLSKPSLISRSRLSTRSLVTLVSAIMLCIAKALSVLVHSVDSISDLSPKLSQIFLFHFTNGIASVLNEQSITVESKHWDLSQNACIPEIYIQHFHSDFTNDGLRQVWMTFIQRLARKRGNSMRISMDVKDYISGNEVCSVKCNGRDIRHGELKGRTYNAQKAPAKKKTFNGIQQSFKLPSPR